MYLKKSITIMPMNKVYIIFNCKVIRIKMNKKKNEKYSVRVYKIH